jgi:hypothetical protein
MAICTHAAAYHYNYGIDVWSDYYRDTPYGIVEVSWMYKKGRVCVSASIPAGATATLCLPDGRELNLESGRHLI